jgi:hypothetical protein
MLVRRETVAVTTSGDVTPSGRPLPRVVTREKVSKSLNLFAARAYLDDFAPVPRQRHHSDKTIAAELPLMVTFQMV